MIENWKNLERDAKKIIDQHFVEMEAAFSRIDEIKDKNQKDILLDSYSKAKLAIKNKDSNEIKKMITTFENIRNNAS